MTAPITAEQVIDVDTWVVQVHAEATPELVTRICRDLNRHSARRVMVAHLPADHPEHQRALAELVDRLIDTFTWTLTPTQAVTLALDMSEATTRPEQCHYCDSFSVVTVEGVDFCHRHAAAYDRRVEESVQS